MHSARQERFTSELRISCAVLDFCQEACLFIQGDLDRYVNSFRASECEGESNVSAAVRFPGIAKNEGNLFDHCA